MGAITFILDCECYSNYFQVSFKNINTREYMTFCESPDESIPHQVLATCLSECETIGFNSWNYDIPLLALVLRGYSVEELYRASFQLINGARVRDFCKQHQITIDHYNHIDLIEVAPLTGSLKIYAGRLHCTRMQEVNFDAHKPLSKEQATVVRGYCLNDLDNTELLYNELLGDLQLRQRMSREYQVDLRSKSDAQIAETVICSEVRKINGHWPKRPTLEAGSTFQYKVPSFLSFKTPVFQRALADVKSAVFEINDAGQPTCPQIEAIRVHQGTGCYQMGLGGLHSTEKAAKHVSDANTVILDRDVKSFYPAIILSQELYPRQMGKAFLQVYRTLVRRRLAAKGVERDALKITINGSFGKYGDMWSKLYSPSLLMQVTITGQLALLMLIEAIELIGVPVVSANTDGVLIKCPVAALETLQATIQDWERQTTFETEETRYQAVYARDVNNYIAVKTDGTCKTKGCYSELGSARNSLLAKNPEAYICSTAAQQFLAFQKPLESSIFECDDIRKFICVRNVKGGAHRNGEWLGKAVRWYYSTQVRGCLQYVKTGNKVPKTDNAMPCMELPKKIPQDLDYAYYIESAKEILREVGYSVQPKLF